MPIMNLFHASVLLFTLNLLDALLTIIWVRNGVATEGNHLMAKLLEIGDFTFLGTKLAIGTFAVFVFLRWGNESKIAKYGISLALAIYISLMGIHLVTGLSALGMVTISTAQDLKNLAKIIFAVFV